MTFETNKKYLSKGICKIRPKMYVYVENKLIRGKNHVKFEKKSFKRKKFVKQLNLIKCIHILKNKIKIKILNKIMFIKRSGIKSI